MDCRAHRSWARKDEFFCPVRSWYNIWYNNLVQRINEILSLLRYHERLCLPGILDNDMILENWLPEDAHKRKKTFAVADEEWAIAEFLAFFQGMKHVKLSRHGVLTFDIANSIQYDLFNDQDRIFLSSRFPHLKLKFPAVFLNSSSPYQPFAHAFAMRPDGQIGALQYEKKKERYPIHQVGEKNARVKWIRTKNTVYQDENDCYKTTISDPRANILGVKAGVAMAPAFFRKRRQSTNNKKQPTFKKVEFLNRRGRENLHAFLNKSGALLTDAHVRTITRRLCQLLEQLHTGTFTTELEACLHRDIKCRNITINPWAERLEDLLFIIDFDDALPLTQGQDHVWGPRAGTHRFLAPEIYQHSSDPEARGTYITVTKNLRLYDAQSDTWVETGRQGPCIRSTTAIDVYALGVCIAEILEKAIHVSDSLKSQMRQLIVLMTETDPQQRWNLTSALALCDYFANQPLAPPLVDQQPRTISHLQRHLLQYPSAFTLTQGLQCIVSQTADSPVNKGLQCALDYLMHYATVSIFSRHGQLGAMASRQLIDELVINTISEQAEESVALDRIQVWATAKLPNVGYCHAMQSTSANHRHSRRTLFIEAFPELGLR